MDDISIVQRFLPGVGAGAINTATGKSIHARQGQLDGACGVYCGAMSLTLLGHLKCPAELISKRPRKTAAAVWQEGAPTFFEGTTAEQLAAIVNSAGPSVAATWNRAGNAKLSKDIANRIREGSLPIVGWQSKNRRFDHWTLAVGIEVEKLPGSVRPIALLCLDPNEEAPNLCAYNARIELGSRYARFARYVTARAVLDVALNEVVWVDRSS